MKKQCLISIPYYEFACPDEILQDAKEVSINRTDWIRNSSNSVTKNKEIDCPSLVNWINECLKKVQDDVYHDLSADIKLTKIWVNKSTRMEFHHKHSHSNSILSGILYLNVFDGYGKTVFYYPDPWWEFQNSRLMQFTKTTLNNTIELVNEITPEEGKLVIFPSHILHSTKPTTVNKERYTIAFNSFLRGSIGLSETANELDL